jgi:hypothetical protein
MQRCPTPSQCHRLVAAVALLFGVSGSTPPPG